MHQAPRDVLVVHYEVVDLERMRSEILTKLQGILDEKNLPRLPSRLLFGRVGVSRDGGLTQVRSMVGHQGLEPPTYGFEGT